jgi:hypothetical protein
MKTVLRGTTALALFLFAFVACSGSATTGTGVACTVDTDCGEPRVCRQGACADTTTGNPPAGSSGTGGTGGTGGTSGGPSEADASTPLIYCGSAGPSSCVCGHTTNFGTAGAACGSSTVTAPGLCCGQPGWPSSSSCTCYQLACDQYSTDTCICGAAGTLKHPVPSCSAPAGGVCCMGDGAGGTQLCSCHKTLTQCAAGEQVVSSCSVAAIGCTGSTKVGACQ